MTNESVGTLTRPHLLIPNGVHANLGGGAAMSDEPLKAPFPYPGGKSRVADLVWRRFGDVDNYVEPFAGSLAVLLRRPADHFAGGYRVETANDANHFIVNFWRAVAAEPERVAGYADWPVTEVDLHARHKWLMRSEESAAWRKRMSTDPEAFDAKIAGWWVWGQCCWIGPGWCAAGTDCVQLPVLTEPCGGHRTAREEFSGALQAPEMSSRVGRGDTAAHTAKRGGRPQLADAFDIGRGVNGGAAQVGYSTCDARRAWLAAWMSRLADRLRLVRTCYGHWARVCDSDSTLTRLGTTGVFLDPPYPTHRADTGKGSRAKGLYATDAGADLNALRDEVLAWCRKWGGDPQIRVALCCYEGDGYEPLSAEGWTVHEWETKGGYGNQRKNGKGKSENARRERIYFSPACLPEAKEPTLFDSCE